MKNQHRLLRLILKSIFLLYVLFIISLPFPLSAQTPQDDDVVRVSTDLVVLNVTVVNSEGRYVHHLKKSDFNVFEDAREQTISSFSAEETPFAAVVLLDTSGSMEQRMTLARAAAIHFLEGLRSEDVAAVYNFDSKVQLIQDFSPSHDLVYRGFSVRAQGVTSLNDAVMRASQELAKRPEKRRAILVISDGADNHSAATQDRALAAALTANATIYTVNMADIEDRNSREGHMATNALRTFAEKSGGIYVDAPGGLAMREAFSGILEELGNQYTIAYEPTNRTHDGRWRAINIKLTRPELKARTRKGYRAQRQG
ncbi:MAG TPA: VWA domain-containing protein [Pyrinomonadaceae bacterium]|nr:VWA domain-containing protein [Pyrinomonadaceae bacterium]